jgi:hypothetical protein
MHSSIQLHTAALPRIAQQLGAVLRAAINLLADPADKLYPFHAIPDQQARQLADVWAQFDPRCAADLRSACNQYQERRGN